MGHVLLIAEGRYIEPLDPAPTQWRYNPYKTFVINFVRCDLSVFWYFKELIHMCVSSQSALYLIYILLSINDIQRQIPVDNSQVMSTACLISADRDYIYISLYFEK